MPEKVETEPLQPAFLPANQVISDFILSSRDASDLDSATVAAVIELYQSGKLTKKNLCKRLEEIRK